MQLERQDDKKLHNFLPSTSTPASVSCPLVPIPLPELPQDIIFSILKLLPVKSILRFKCVSKDWLSLLSSPKFVSVHRQLTSDNPLKHSFIFHNFGDDKISLLNVNSAEMEPISLVIPSSAQSKKIELVGSINGLVCLSCCTPEQVIILWNPAMNLCKSIRPPVKDADITKLGFAYDSVNDDYKVIRIDYFEPKKKIPQALIMSRAEVYSASLDSWKRVQIDSPFDPYITGSVVIAKGIPYWSGVNWQDKRKHTEVFVYYDMQNETFKTVRWPRLGRYHYRSATPMEWKGNLGMIVFPEKMENAGLIGILVYNEMRMRWSLKKISSHGPLPFKLESTICSREGIILAEAPEEKLVLYDTVTNNIKELCIPGAVDPIFHCTFSYTESLVALKGMEQSQAG